MKLLKLIRSTKDVRFVVEKANEDGHIERFDVTAPEAPKASLDRALTALVPMIAAVVGYASPAGIFPVGIAVSYTKRGTRSVSVRYLRTLPRTNRNYLASTPLLQLDEPADDEEGKPEVTTAEGNLIIAMITEARMYAEGERQQTLLPLDEPPAPAENPEAPADLFGEPENTQPGASA
ncbi:hypothetical protein [Thiocapsa sp. N5-Cardenillas]|uniref:hypothetical protein n=1 Tax=Thiocapsa sp. N5-Cardenillas TaxID=3137397 RepID=UPI0035AD7C88